MEIGFSFNYDMEEKIPTARRGARSLAGSRNGRLIARPHLSRALSKGKS